MFKIKWTKDALLAQSDILKFWTEHNDSNLYSIKLSKEVKNKITLISKNPSSGKVSKFLGVRYVLILKHFSLYYRIKEDKKEIEILSFWDNRRNPENLEL
jgi:plasmid stabilization system protein ParE